MIHSTATPSRLSFFEAVPRGRRSGLEMRLLNARNAATDGMEFIRRDICFEMRRKR